MDRYSAGPVAEEAVLVEDVWDEFWDSVNGGHLEGTKVKEARREEIDWVNEE